MWMKWSSSYHTKDPIPIQYTLSWSVLVNCLPNYTSNFVSVKKFVHKLYTVVPSPQLPVTSHLYFLPQNVSHRYRVATHPMSYPMLKLDVVIIVLLKGLFYFFSILFLHINSGVFDATAPPRRHTHLKCKKKCFSVCAHQSKYLQY